MHTNNAFAAFAVLYRRDARGKLQILLIQDRDKPGIWKNPGGKSETGETPHQALTRELHQEINIWIDVHSIGQALYVAPLPTHTFTVYPVPYSRRFGVLHMNEVELLRMQWFELEKIRRMIDCGHILPHHTAALLNFIEWQET